MDSERFYDYNSARNWCCSDGTHIHDWRGYLRSWAKHERRSDDPETENVLNMDDIFGEKETA